MPEVFIAGGMRCPPSSPYMTSETPVIVPVIDGEIQPALLSGLWTMGLNGRVDASDALC